MFFLPLFDENPSKNVPLVTWFFIGLCFIIFFYQYNLTNYLELKFIYKYSFIPFFFNDFNNENPVSFLNPYLTLVTSAFLHAGWMHILGNMLYLWIFGDNVEDSMGSVKFFVFYLLCAIGGSLLQYFSNPTSDIPIVGASGAIAGVLGSYLILYPKANIKVFMWVIIIIRTINVPAWIVLSVWILGQFFSVSAGSSSGGGGVAYFAHIGGFITGMALTPLMRKKGTPLFNEQLTSPWEISKANKSDIKRTFTHNRSSSLPSFKRTRSSLPKFRK